MFSLRSVDFVTFMKTTGKLKNDLYKAKTKTNFLSNSSILYNILYCYLYLLLKKMYK